MTQKVQSLIQVIRIAAVVVQAREVYENHAEIIKRNVHVDETQIQMTAALSQVVRQARHRRHHLSMDQNDRSAIGNPLENHPNTRTIEGSQIRNQSLTLKR